MLKFYIKITYNKFSLKWNLNWIKCAQGAREKILNGWKNIVEKDQSGEKPIHRSREFEKDIRFQEKSVKKTNWYKGKDGKKFESVMMIPATPHGELKHIIEEKAKNAHLKVKIVEKAGQKLSSYLRKFDKTNNEDKLVWRR